MTQLTFEDLMAVIRECAGESEAGGVGAEAQDTDFDDLGYDSLALMETAARLQRDYGVELPDETVVDIRTPRQLLDLLNSKLAPAV
jgi:act minimal PKS acyl carrier protein